MIYALHDHHPYLFAQEQRPATEGNANGSIMNTKQGFYNQSAQLSLSQQGYPFAYDSNALNASDCATISPVDRESELTAGLIMFPDLSPNSDILFTPPMNVNASLEGYWFRMGGEEGSATFFDSIDSDTFSPRLELEVGMRFGLGGQLAGDTEATPPLAFDLDVPIPNLQSSNPELQPSSHASKSASVHPNLGMDGSRTTAPPSIELLAPKPMRLINPAIHLAALVEEEEESTAPGTSSWIQQEEVQDTHARETEQLEEYMSDSSDSMEEDVEEFASSVPPFPTSAVTAKLDEWSFPSIVQIAPVESNSFDQSSPYGTPYPSTYGVAPQWHPRTAQLQESLRSRRATRMAGNAHGRHASLPDVQYRPVKWNLPPPSEEGLQTRIAGRHKEMKSIDWSSFGLQNMPLPSLDAVHWQSPIMPYRRQSITHPYGMR